MIKINNLSFSYDNQEILKDISFTVENKEFVGIIGPNGGGKSTTLKLILGLLKPSKGEIIINAKKISYVPQAAKINPSFPVNVLDLVLMGTLHKYAVFYNNKKDINKALECLELVKMRDFAKHKFAELSGGQQQRVLIARALLSGCDMLLLDEPTASIDSKGQIEIFELLKTLNENNMSILCVCHDVALLSSYATKIIHIKQSCYIHTNICGIDKNKLLHLAKHKDHLCELDIWSNYGISSI